MEFEISKSEFEELSLALQFYEISNGAEVFEKPDILDLWTYKEYKKKNGEQIFLIKRKTFNRNTKTTNEKFILEY